MTRRHQLTLTADETRLLAHILNNGSPAETRRARIIQLTAAGLPQFAIAAEVGLSERQVRRWQRAFENKRMAIFRGRPAAAPDSPPAAEQRERPPVPSESESAQVEVIPPPPGVEAPRRKLRLAKKPGVLPDDPMSEAGRKILHFHLERMLLHEPGSRLGEDIEAVHDMRVATRRIRSAFDAFRAFYRPKAIRPFLLGLRRTARRLGAVRDMDVFLEKLAAYQASLSPEQRESLEPLVAACQNQREIDRARLIAHLDSRDFAVFVETFADFLETPGAGARKARRRHGRPVAYQVRHVAPRLIYERYEAVRAYETLLDEAPIETLHALRIEGKRLRYILEFFAEVLGPEAKPVIEEAKALQDHLGSLNDAEVAGRFLQDFISQYERSQIGVRIAERRSIEGVIQYMAYQFAEKHRLTATFPETWAHFNRAEVRRALALAVAAL